MRFPKFLTVFTFVIAFTAPARAIAQEQVAAAPLHPELAQHTKHFEKKVYKVGDRVYSAVGYSLGNIIMIVGDDGVIVVDTGLHPVEAAEAWKELRKYSDKPVKAVVYTHFHPDHWGGVKAIVTQEQVDAGKVQIIAHKTLLNNVIHQGGVIGPILAMRSAYSFGYFLDEHETIGMNHGIGPEVTSGTSTFIKPTLVLSDQLTITIAGVDMIIKHVPSEAPDEIAVYLPKDNILMTGEATQGPTLPNIHTIRGTKFRDPYQWYKSLDVLRGFKAGHMVPSHGQPIYGAENVEETIRMTRDGIQYIHDQTLRYMNKGATPDELAQLVKFPKYMEEFSPYLREYYGTIKHSTRQIYNGYLGWFKADPVDLDPTAPKIAAKRYIKLMGGRGKILAHAEDAIEDKDYQWAAELVTHLILADNDDMKARKVKANAYRKLAYASVNINWRSWYLTAAAELEGRVKPLKGLLEMVGLFSSPDIIQQWSLSKILEGMSVRLNPELSLNSNITINFMASDTKENHALEVRRTILQFHEKSIENAKATIVAPRQAILGLIAGKISKEQFIHLPSVNITGSEKEFNDFMGLFDAMFSPIKLTVR